MKVLDLYCGLKGFSQAFEDRSHDVITVDIDKKFKPTICKDVMELRPEDFKTRFDIILASPPCNCFTVMTISRYWTSECKPKKETQEAIRLVAHTLNLILQNSPKFWYLENPRGMLRNVLGKPQAQTYFASWGVNYLKPTDIWGKHAKMSWGKNNRNLLMYERAPRGSQKGVQKLESPEERAKIPYALSEAICLACEKENENYG